MWGKIKKIPANSGSIIDDDHDNDFVVVVVVFCGMVDQRRAFSLISSQEDSQRSLLLQIFNKPQKDLHKTSVRA